MKTDDTTKLLAVDVEAITALADKAGSAIATITLNEAVSGVPTTIPVFVDRKNGTVSSVATLFESYRTHPAQKKGTAKVKTLYSLVELTNRHKTAASVIFAETDWQKPSLTAIIDYHENAPAGAADNGKHRIHYEFPLSEEWKSWVGINAKPMTQIDFAQFVEDHSAELAAPTDEELDDYKKRFGFKVAYPNELVSLSRGLQIHAETRVKNSVVLQSGEGEITWDEEHKDAAGNKIVVPGLFILSIPMFFDGDSTRIPVRLRYRVSAGAVVWTCQLYRPDKYVSEEVMRQLTSASSQTALPAYQGTPEMPA